MKSVGIKEWQEFNLLRLKGLLTIDNTKEDKPYIWTEKGRDFLTGYNCNPDEVTPEKWVKFILSSLD